MADNDIDLNVRVRTQSAELEQLINQFREAGQVSERSAEIAARAARNELGTIEQLELQLRELNEARRNARTQEDLVKINSAIQQTERNLRELNQVGRDSGKAAEFFGDKLEGLTGELGSVAKSLGVGGAAIVGFIGLLGAASTAAINAAQATAAFAKDQLAIQRSTGASASFVASLSSIIKQYGGEIQNVQELLLQVGSVVNTAVADPTGVMAAKFKQLGVAFTDVSGRARSVEDVLRDIDNTAKNTGLTISQLSTLSTITGEEAAKQFLDRFGQIQDLESQLKQTGAVLSEELTQRANEFNKSGQLLKDQLDGLTFSLGGELLDALKRVNGIASETLNNIDPRTLEGFKGLIQDLGRALVATAETASGAFDLLVDGVRDSFGTTLIPGLGQFAEAATAILSPIESLKIILFNEYPIAANKSDISTKNLVQTFTAGTFAAEALSKKIKQLADDQKFLADIVEISTAKQIDNIKELERLGKISAQDAADRINQLEDEKLKKATDNAFIRLAKVNSSFREQTKRLEEEAQKELKIEQDITTKKKQARADLERFERESFERLAGLQSDANKSIEGAKRLEAARQTDNALLLQKQTYLKQLEKAEINAGENTKKAAKELADFRSAINLDELVDEKQLSEDKLKAREIAKNAFLELQKAEEAERKKNLEQRRNDEKTILADRQTTLHKIDEEEKLATAKLAEQLKQQKITQDQFNQQELAEKIKFAQKKLEAEQLALTKLNVSENTSFQEKVATTQRVETLRTQIAADQTTERIATTQREFNALKLTLEAEQSFRAAAFETRKSQIAQIKDLNLKRIQEFLLERDIAQENNLKALEKVTLEQKALDVLRAQSATKEQLLAQEGKIALAIAEANKVREQARVVEKKILDEKLQNAAKAIAANQAEVDSLDARSKAFVKGLEQVGQKLNQIADFFKVTFNPDNFNLDGLVAAEKQLQKFRDIAAETKKELTTGFGAFSTLLQAQLIIAEEAVIELENKTNLARQRLAQENARKQAEILLQEQRQQQSQSFELFKNFQEELGSLKKDFRTRERELTKELAQSEKDEEEDLKNFQKEQEDDLTAFDKEQSDKRIAQAEEERLAKEEQAQQTVDNIKEINRQSADKEADERIKSLTERGKIESQIAVLGAKQETAETKAEIEKLKKDLQALDAAEKARQDRVKERDKQIGEAQKSAQKKLKNAKTKEEVDAINEELEIITKGINDRFDIEEEKNAKLKELQGKASAETLRLLAEEFEKKKKIALEEEKAQIESNARKVAQQKAALEAQAKAQAEADKKARDEFLANQKKDFDDRQKAFDDKQQQLKDELDKERSEYKKHLSELRTNTAESLAEIGSSFTDGGKAAEEFFKKFAEGAGISGKAIDDILKKIGQFKQQIADDKAQSGQASPSSSPTSTPTITGGSSSTPSNDPLTGTGKQSFIKSSSQSSTPSSTSSPSTSSTTTPSTTPSSSSANASIVAGNPDKGGKPDREKDTGSPSTGFNVPNSAKDDVSFKKGMLSARDRFFATAKFNQKGNIKLDDKSIKAQDDYGKARGDLIRSYLGGVKIDEKTILRTMDKFSTVAQDRDPRPYVALLDETVNLVEAKRQEDEKKPVKTADSIGSLDKPDRKPDVSPTGGNSPTPIPGGSQQPVKDPVLAAREAENFSEIEEQNAETGAQLRGPNFPSPPSTPSEPGASPSSPASEPSDNISATGDGSTNNVSASAGVSASAVIEKLINIEQVNITAPNGSQSNGKFDMAVLAKALIPEITKLIPEEPELVNVMAGELDRKSSRDFAARNPLRQFKV